MSYFTKFKKSTKTKIESSTFFKKTHALQAIDFKVFIKKYKNRSNQN